MRTAGGTVAFDGYVGTEHADAGKKWREKNHDVKRSSPHTALSPAMEQSLSPPGDLNRFGSPRAKQDTDGFNGGVPSTSSSASISPESVFFACERRNHDPTNSSSDAVEPATAVPTNRSLSPQNREGFSPPRSVQGHSGGELDPADGCEPHSSRNRYSVPCSGYAARPECSAACPGKVRRDGLGKDVGKGEGPRMQAESWVASEGLHAGLQGAETDSPRTAWSCEASETSEAWRWSNSRTRKWAPAVGVSFFGLTCMAGTSYGSLTCYLASYLRQVGLQNVGFQEMLLVCALHGALQALATPLSVKLLSFLSLPLSALLSGWLVTASLLLSAFLLSADILVAHPFLFYCVYAGVGGLGGGLLHGLPLGGRQRPGFCAGERKAGCSVSASVAPARPSEPPGFGGPVPSRGQAPFSRKILGEDSWRLRERFYLQDEILARLPLLLMGTATAFAIVQFVASFLLQPRERAWESECLPGEFIGCEVSVEEQSPLVTQSAPQMFYGEERTPAAAHTSRLSVVVSTMNQAGNEASSDPFMTPSHREADSFTCVLVAVVTAIQGMAFFLVQASWRFVGQEDFQISDHGVSYINAGSVALLFLFSVFNAPFFALKDKLPDAPPFHREGNHTHLSSRTRGVVPSVLPWLWCLSGLVLASEGVVASLAKAWSTGGSEALIRDTVRVGWFERSNPLTTYGLFFLWLSGVRILDAWTTWLAFPYAQSVLKLPPSRLLVLLCSAKAAGAGALAWLSSTAGVYSTHGIGGLCGVAGGSLVLAGLAARALHCCGRTPQKAPMAAT
ncbi:conserved hypothetical protein [Neospora caninum Liverpool]|uniref:Transmembrane protein n=1 Tax=Neospora caninum (strain Liverpool) TaxID=572307 RepID=F0VG88_NEOCL|nr:conserved hypothetical protein [Neospora caninum Liverpool]CBZ52732.1 conserved hypothetical protein [Neospora caninum Liverpool]CEL66713.1 TPA: hypothetical protein BN1204_025200 [Neospora caninum Liverpool]|eukprot:XP_003882764.1 conserved hypothetical protein [Neospora caninum Liverpool]